MKRTVLSAAMLAAFGPVTTAAHAQTASTGSAQAFPAKQIRLIVPLAPGGNLDIVARAVAAPMGDAFGHQVIVENRPGASSLVGTQFVAKAPADGYTILAIANTFATVPSLMHNPDLNKRFIERGVELVASATPNDFTAYVKAEFDKKGKLAREAGIRIE